MDNETLRKAEESRLTYWEQQLAECEEAEDSQQHKVIERIIALHTERLHRMAGDCDGAGA